MTAHLLCSTVPLHFIAPLLRSTASRYCSALLLRYTATLLCSAPLLCSSEPLYCSTLLVRSTAPQYYSAPLNRSIAPRYCSALLLHNTTPLHFPLRRLAASRTMASLTAVLGLHAQHQARTQSEGITSIKASFATVPIRHTLPLVNVVRTRNGPRRDPTPRRHTMQTT